MHSTDGGATFAPAAGISPLDAGEQPLLRAPPLPTATVDASGRLFVAWADCAFRRGCDGNTIVLTSSTDGTTWSTAEARSRHRLRQLRSGDRGRSDHSRPHVDRDVRAQLVDAAAQRRARSASSVTSSRDGGATWTKPQRLDGVAPRYSWLADAGGQFLGDYIGATYAGGRFVPVFALASRPLASGRLREYMMSASIP